MNKSIENARLEKFLNPKASKIRPYLALFALHNYQKLKDGKLVGNNPSITWYVEKLRQWRISGNYYGVRRQLWKMADAGILEVRHIERPIATYCLNRKRITSISHAEFYVVEKRIPELVRIIKSIFPEMPSKPAIEKGVNR